jgi:hypothetical protein
MSGEIARSPNYGIGQALDSAMRSSAAYLSGAALESRLQSLGCTPLDAGLPNDVESHTRLIAVLQLVRPGSDVDAWPVPPSTTLGGFDDDPIVGVSGDEAPRGLAGNDILVDWDFNDEMTGDAGPDDLVVRREGQEVVLESGAEDPKNRRFVVAADDVARISSGANATVDADGNFVIPREASAGALTIGRRSPSTGVTGTIRDHDSHRGPGAIPFGPQPHRCAGGLGRVELSHPGADADLFVLRTKNDSILASFDSITDCAAGDVLAFPGMAGVQLRATAFAWQGSISSTVAAINGDVGIADARVFFTDGANGYLFLKGAGSGTDFSGTLVRLNGRTSACKARKRQASFLHRKSPSPAIPLTSWTGTPLPDLPITPTSDLRRRVQRRSLAPSRSPTRAARHSRPLG